MTVDLDRLDALAAGASLVDGSYRTGPWAANDGCVMDISASASEVALVAECSRQTDAEFIAACDPETVQQLVCVARVAQRVVAEAGRYTGDGVPLAPSARFLYDALAPFRGPVAAAEDAG